MPFESGEALFTLLRRCRLTRREQQVIVAVLGAETPLTAMALAKRTRLHYSHCKAVVRELVAWNILERTRDGLRFRPSSKRWGPPNEATLEAGGGAAGGMAARPSRLATRSHHASVTQTGPISVPSVESNGRL